MIGRLNNSVGDSLSWISIVTLNNISISVFLEDIRDDDDDSLELSVDVCVLILNVVTMTYVMTCVVAMIATTNGVTTV